MPAARAARGSCWRRRWPRWSRGPTFEHASVAFGVLSKIAGDLPVARKRLEAAHREVVRRGDDRSLPFLLFHLAELECWAGDLGLAGRYARDGNELAFRTGQEATRAFTLYAVALVAAHRGEVDERRERAGEALEVSERTGVLAARAPAWSVLGFLEVSLGDMAAALRWLG